MAITEEQLLIRLEASSTKLERQLADARRTIDRFAANATRSFDQMNARNAASFDRLNRSVQSSMSGLQNIIGPVAGSLGVREIINYADAWATAENKIAAASQVSGLQARSLEELKDGANEARSELESYVDLYARLLRVAPAVAASEMDVAKATDIVAKSLKAGGASAQEQASTLLQLGQALASGYLQGDELRSLRESAPLLAQAIADEFGVTIGELKELGAAGELISARVLKAILGANDKIQAAFDATQSTIGDAIDRLRNEFTAYIGLTGEATGATQGLIDALNYLAENFTDIADVVLQFAAILAGALAGKAIAGVVVGLGQAIAALGVFLTALRAGTLTATVFTAALGPIGLIAGAAAAAIILLNNSQYDAAAAATAHRDALVENQDKMDLARGSSDKFRAALQQQIALQLAAADAALVEARAQLEAANTRAGIATIFGGVMSAASEALGLGGAPERGKEYADSILGPAEAQLTLAEQRVADLRRQLQEIEVIRTTPPGDDDIVDPPGSPPGRSGSKGNKFESALEDIRKRTELLLAETEARRGLNPLINDYGFALERARSQTQLLQAAQEAGIAITPELRAQIALLAETYATASVEAEKLTESQQMLRTEAEAFRDTAKSVLRGFIDDLKEGKDATEVLNNALSKVGDLLLTMGLDALFGGGSFGGKGFGFLGSLFGFKNGGIAANGRPIKTFGNGGVSRSAAIFGEAGPEAAVPLPDGRRIPVEMRGPAPRSVGGQLSVAVTTEVVNGNLMPTIVRVSGDVAGMRIQQTVPVMIKDGAPVAVATRSQQNGDWRVG